MDAAGDREFWQFSDRLRLQSAAGANASNSLSDGFSSLSLSDSIWTPQPRQPNLPADAFAPSAKLAFGNPFSSAAAARFNAAPNRAASGSGSGSAFGGKAFANSGDFKSYFNKPSADHKSTTAPKNPHHHANNGYGHGKKNAGGADSALTKKKNAVHNAHGGTVGAGADKRFKTLPASEALPREEAIGGYIFVCNNDTMDENLRRHLFGLPSRYRDSVRAIRPGLPLFLYNYSTHQLHGIFEAASFGGTNIDPTAWEDKKNPGESRFPAQVRVAERKICNPLEEDAFRPILHHYDGPKFRLELSVPEALALLDIFAEDDGVPTLIK